MRRARALAGALTGALVAAALPGRVAAQALTPTSQDRRVSVHVQIDASGGTYSNTEQEIAPDFGPFSAGVNGTPWPNLPQYAVQDSRIDPDGLHASGYTSALALNSPSSVTQANYLSDFRVGFDVAETTPFELTGSLDTELQGCDAWTHGVIRLSGPNGVIAEVEGGFSEYPDPQPCIGCQASLPIAASGVMTPGSYTLEARSSGFSYEAQYPGDPCDSANGTTHYDVHLALSPPQVPALPAAWGAVLAAALALAARRRG